jgi:hypothetical protein
MVGSFDDCRARAAIGHVAAAPPSSVRNWRRLRSSMGSPPKPAVPAYSRLRMHRKRPQVLGVDLNRSEIAAWGALWRRLLVGPSGEQFQLVIRPG